MKQRLHFPRTKSATVLLILCTVQNMFAQVPKKVVVEHFTNTKCSVCASRNPGFYTNYNAQSGVIHLAIHPSAPYSACFFNQHNVSENDARTNFYGVYGSTPRLVIQGSVIPGSANYSQSSLFSPFLSQTSPASIKIRQVNYGADSIRTRVVITTEAAHTLQGLSLFVALAEDTINYTGSNGEAVHFDVFRKTLTGVTGISVALPPTVGDSVVFTKSSTINAAWTIKNLFSLVILQETASKAVVQSEKSSANKSSTSNPPTGLLSAAMNKDNYIAYAIENTLVLQQKVLSVNTVVSVYALSGQLLLEKTLSKNSETIVLPNDASGIYFYRIREKDTIVKSGKFFIQ